MSELNGVARITRPSNSWWAFALLLAPLAIGCGATDAPIDDARIDAEGSDELMATTDERGAAVEGTRSRQPGTGADAQTAHEPEPLPEDPTPEPLPEAETELVSITLRGGFAGHCATSLVFQGVRVGYEDHELNGPGTIRTAGILRPETAMELKSLARDLIDSDVPLNSPSSASDLCTMRVTVSIDEGEPYEYTWVYSGERQPWADDPEHDAQAAIEQVFDDLSEALVVCASTDDLDPTGDCNPDPIVDEEN